MKTILEKRQGEILEILVSDYISSAQPVGSRTIAKKYAGHLSPATIRNVMADLTEMGLLEQPHTSAGRIPTSVGIKIYVDTLLKTRDLTDGEKDTIRERCAGSEKEINQILKRTSRMLANVSHYAGLVATPSAKKVIFKQIQFLPLSRNRLLGIFVSRDGMVQNRLIEVNEDFSYPEIERITNYCNNFLMGLSLDDAREKISKELEMDYSEYDHLLKRAIQFSSEVLGNVPESDLMIDGEFLLLDMPEFAQGGHFKELVSELEKKRQVLHVLERCAEGGGVKIFIGSEANLGNMDTVGLVGAPYFKDGKVIGALGVVGPVRMDYSSVVPIVDFTSKVLSDVLEA